jgi:hypothetical protein
MFEVFDSICKLKGPVYLVPILSHEDHEGHEAADHTAPRRGRLIGRPTDRAAAKRKPRASFCGVCLGRRALHPRRSLAGVAPQRLRRSPPLFDFVFFVLFVAFILFVVTDQPASQRK